MNGIIGRQIIINGVDIWEEYGVFLVEDKRGDLTNLSSILTPSKMKTHTGVDIRERNGKSYSSRLDVANEERNVTLYFAQYAATKSAWLRKYTEFISFLKQGQDAHLPMEGRSAGIQIQSDVH